MKYSFLLARSKNVFVGLCFLVLTTSVDAQFVQQGNKLVGSGAVDGAGQQGHSVSLSSDGNTAIVGGTVDNGTIGAAWVWTRSGGVWTQEGGKLVGSGSVGSETQGSSVSLSSDGNTAIVGVPDDNGPTGGAWVWTRSDGVWAQQGGKLVGSPSFVSEAQGHSVSLSSDGNTAIVGGPLDNSATGAAWVWTRSGGVWTQQGGKLVGSSSGGGAAQGSSVSLSSDGNTAIVGGPRDNGGVGAAWVWTRSDGVWTQQGGKLVGSGSNADDFQGYSVSLSSDGNTAMVGANDGKCTCAARVWTRSDGVWAQQGGKLVGSGAAVGLDYPAGYGSSVSLSSDGNSAIIGGLSDSGYIGAAWVWTRSGGVWTQKNSKLVGSGAVGGLRAGAGQGSSVSLSSDGNTAIVGGPLDNSGSGAVWIFTQNESSILQTKSFIPRLGILNGNSFQFDLPQNEKVMIQLYNAKGEALSQLLNDTRKAGLYSIPLPIELNGSFNFLDYRAGDYHETLKIHP